MLGNLDRPKGPGWAGGQSPGPAGLCPRWRSHRGRSAGARWARYCSERPQTPWCHTHCARAVNAGPSRPSADDLIPPHGDAVSGSGPFDSVTSLGFVGAGRRTRAALPAEATVAVDQHLPVSTPSGRRGPWRSTIGHRSMPAGRGISAVSATAITLPRGDAGRLPEMDPWPCCPAADWRPTACAVVDLPGVPALARPSHDYVLQHGVPRLRGRCRDLRRVRRCCRHPSCLGPVLPKLT